MTVQAGLGFNMHHAAAKSVPYLLTQEVKEHSIKVCQELHKRANDVPLWGQNFG